MHKHVLIVEIFGNTLLTGTVHYSITWTYSGAVGTNMFSVNSSLSHTFSEIMFIALVLVYCSARR